MTRTKCWSLALVAAVWGLVGACGQAELVVGTLGAGGGNASSCTPDGAVCDDAQSCCSAQCRAGRCSALTTACRTSGNPCSEGGDCCSGLCTDGRCDAASSFCRQTNDLCFADAECCSFACIVQGDGPSGVCGAPPVGPSNCQRGIAGSLCDGCNDCCSRVCAPYADSGLSICQEAQGCRQTGELCRSDAECCGGELDSGLPGAGKVECAIEPGRSHGICRNARACSPQGNACHFQDYACGVSAASNRCCADSGEEGSCILDEQGVPRCDGLSACRAEGESCASSGDCCSGSCTVGELGGLVCQPTPAGGCASEDAPCTASSECCPGTECQPRTEANWGRCMASERGCSLSGQLCGQDEPCCGDLPCTEGRCVGIGAL